MKLTYKILCVLLTAMLLTGCIKDNEEDCLYPLRLQFSYTYNREDRDLLKEEVPAIHLYLYDQKEGHLVASTSVPVSGLDERQGMEWRVPRGEFTLVAWAGDKMRCAVDPGSLSTGSLMFHPDWCDAAGGVKHRAEHLWHKATPDILINGRQTPVYKVDLHKLSNDLEVTVRSVGVPFGALPQVRATAYNARYSHTGTRNTGSAATYLPEEKYGYGAMSSVHNMTLLGLEPSDQSTLTVVCPRPESRAADDITVYSGALSDLLGESPDTDLDLDDDFHLDFEVNPTETNLAVTLTVNGWQARTWTVSLR